MKNRKINFKIIIFSLIVVAIGVFFIIGAIKDNREDDYDSSSFTYKYNNQEYEQNDDLELILFTGLDTYENNYSDSYRNAKLADCIVLLVLDKEEKTVLPIQINRDSMCNYHILGIGGRITNDAYGQIALSHSYGDGGIESLVNVKNAVSDLLTGINIDYYVSMSMNAVGIVNDKAGGVEVLVEDDFSGIDDTLIQNEICTLHGDHALTFVRSRYGLDDPSNINRLNRQRVYLRALYDKCKTLVNSDADFVTSTLNSVGQYIVANTNIYGLSDMANTLLDYELLDAIQLEGNAKVGQEGFVEFNLDQDKLIELCINTFYKKAN